MKKSIVYGVIIILKYFCDLKYKISREMFPFRWFYLNIFMCVYRVIRLINEKKHNYNILKSFARCRCNATLT